MKIIPNCLLAFCIIFSTLMISCTKETTEEEQSNSTYRIVSTKGYNKNILTSETTYEYVENKISKVSFTSFREEFYDSQWIYTYPEKNKVFISQKKEGLDLTREIEFTISNGKLVERLDFDPYDSYTKTTIVYNSDNKVESIKKYVNNNDWELQDEEIYSYISGKLLRINFKSYKYDRLNEGQYSYTYNGNEIAEISMANKIGVDWHEWSKLVYTYTDGKVVKVTQRVKDANENWLDYYYYEYTFDSSGNLIKQTSTESSGPNFASSEYTYEEGSSNNSQLAYPGFNLQQSVSLPWR